MGAFLISFVIFYVRYKKMSWFEDALKLDPYLAISHAWLALVYYHLGKYDRAVHYFTRAIDLYNINDAINYRPLGLDVTISKSELYFDRALCHYKDKEMSMCVCVCLVMFFLALNACQVLIVRSFFFPSFFFWFAAKAKSDLLLAKPGGSESLKQVINILLESLDYIERSEEERLNAAIYENRGRIRRSGSVDESHVSPTASKDGNMFESRKRSLPVSRNSIFTVLSDFVYEDEVDNILVTDGQETRAQEDMELMEFLSGGSDAVEFDKEGLDGDDGQEDDDDVDVVEPVTLERID